MVGRAAATKVFWCCGGVDWRGVEFERLGVVVFGFVFLEGKRERHVGGKELAGRWNALATAAIVLREGDRKGRYLYMGISLCVCESCVFCIV